MLADGAGKAVGTRAVGGSVESQSSLRLATRRELFRIGHGVVVFLGMSAKEERCALSKEEEGEEGEDDAADVVIGCFGMSEGVVCLFVG